MERQARDKMVQMSRFLLTLSFPFQLQSLLRLLSPPAQHTTAPVKQYLEMDCCIRQLLSTSREDLMTHTNDLEDVTCSKEEVAAGDESLALYTRQR